MTVVEKLRSPRETLRTLYYAAILYDVFPEMIDDAVACLDVEGVRAASCACYEVIRKLENGPR